MRLNVFERLVVRNIILGEVQELIDNLFTDQELTDLQIRQEGKEVKWKVKREDGTDIPQERDILVSVGLKSKVGSFLKQLKYEGKLGTEHMALYSKFVE